jgi:hypothetical protein
MELCKHLPKKSKSEKSYGFILLGFVAALIAYPLCIDFFAGRLFLHLWVTLTLVQLMLSQQMNPAYRIKIIALGSLSLLLSIVSLSSSVFNFPALPFFKLLMPFSVLFFFFCVWVIIRSIFNQKQVTLDLIYGSVLAYLLIGISWALIFCCIELFVTDSFSFGSEMTLPQRAGALFYFSFVTLTTLGYGDVLPVTGFSRTITYLESVSGVMYPAILISMLVGKFGLSNVEK